MQQGIDAETTNDERGGDERNHQSVDPTQQ
jgi:hypothetical protein